MVGRERRDENVAVAIDGDKGSQAALKWAVDNLLTPGETLTLVHVRLKQTLANHGGTHPSKCGDEVKDLFLPFRCFCARKDINCEEVVLEEADAAKGIIKYVQENAVNILVLGASKMTLLKRFKAADVTSAVLKGAPSFCTVYAISRGKISSVRSATSSPPPLCTIVPRKSPASIPRHQEEIEMEIKIKSPLLRRGYEEASVTDSDISFDRLSMDCPRLSVCSEFEDNRCSFATSSCSSDKQSIDLGSSYSAFSSSSQESGRLSMQEEVEAEMRRLKLELKYTMDMYSNACKEAIAAKKTTNELQKWKVEREHKVEAARLAKEAAMAMAENEKAKSKAAMEALSMAHRIAEIETHKRKQIEQAEDMRAMMQSDIRYRKYTSEEIEEATQDFSDSHKIGQGPVYKCTLDYTPVAIKVVRPEGRWHFQQEVELLTSIRHPNLLLLLGACTEYGCLVYEYMPNGSLEDHLLRRGNNSPVLSWQLRFRIASEIATALNFLHQMKPDPLVHGDLKPANILLGQHMVSKISHVGLDSPKTINPDIYSFGIMLLQLLTAKPPVSLTHHVERAIEQGTFAEMLDPAVSDWPLEQALVLANIGLKCAQLKCANFTKDVLPELKRLMDIAEESMRPNHSQTDSLVEIIRDPSHGSTSS